MKKTILCTLAALTLLLPVAASHARMPDNCENYPAVVNSLLDFSNRRDQIITTYGGSTFLYPENIQVEYIEIVVEIEYLQGQLAGMAAGGC